MGKYIHDYEHIYNGVPPTRFIYSKSQEQQYPLPAPYITSCLPTTWKTISQTQLISKTLLKPAEVLAGFSILVSLLFTSLFFFVRLSNPFIHYPYPSDCLIAFAWLVTFVVLLHPADYSNNCTDPDDVGYGGYYAFFSRDTNANGGGGDGGGNFCNLVNATKAFSLISGLIWMSHAMFDLSVIKTEQELRRRARTRAATAAHARRRARRAAEMGRYGHNAGL